MHLMRARLVQAAIAVAGGAGLLLASGTAANASPAPNLAPVINVSVTTADGFSLPSVVHAGFVTFNFSSPESDYHGIQGFRPENGKTAADVVHDLELGVLSDSASDNALGATLLQTDATLVGGAVTNGTGTISVTIPLDAGTYYFFDLNDFFAGFSPVRLHTLNVLGRFTWFGLPSFTSVIDAAMINDEPRFVAPTQLSTQENFLAVVSGDEIHEVVFRPTRDGITDDYISTFYDAVVAGTTRPPSPWIGGQTGLQAMSPGRYAVVRVDITPGPYALICYVPSDESGLPHGYIGMHQMEDLS
jgi:hypothetical protein